MDRVSRLRAEAGPASDESGASDPGFQTADDTVGGSSDYLSFSDTDGGTPARPRAALGASTPRRSASDGLAPGLSPIAQAGDALGGHIDASNILSGGVDIFDDYNSNDGDGLVIDDEASNAPEDESRARRSTEKVICEPIESADLTLSTDAGLTLKDISESQLGSADAPTEQPLMKYDVILQIDGTNVDAVDIGNGLYLYRKDDDGELNAIQILEEEGQQPHFKFLKVRELGEGNLEVYEEHIMEVPITDEELEERKQREKKEKENDQSLKKSSHLPIKDLNKALVQENATSCKAVAINANASKEDQNLKSDVPALQKSMIGNSDPVNKLDSTSEPKIKPNPLKNLEGSRKSPILGNYTSMTLHSSPKREGAPLTKTTINLPLNSSRNSDAVKKTIEVSTDNSKLKCNEKITIANSLPPKIEPVNTPLCQTVDTSDVVKNLDSRESNYSKEKNNPQVKTKDEITLSEVDKKVKMPKDADQLSSNTNKPLLFGNSEDKTSSRNKFDNRKDVEKLDGKILDEPKKTIESKSNVSGKSVDVKKDVPSNKSNVVSKWVLRSDSTEDKCKKEREKVPLDNKNLNNTKHFKNDASTRSDLEMKPTTTQKVNLTPVTNVNNVNKSKKEDIKDTTTKSSKLISETVTNAGDKTLQNVFIDSGKLNQNLSQQNETVTCDINPNKSTQRRPEDKDKLIEDEKKFVSKYISEAFGMKKSTTETVESLKSDSIMKKLEVEDKTKNPEKSSNSFDEKTDYDSPLRIDVESISKPVPFGKWTEGDKQEYLNKLKEHKLPSNNPSLSPVKSYQLASSKNDLKRFELKKRNEADTFERAHLSSTVQVPNPVKPEDITKKRVTDVKGLIDETIEGLIKDQLLGTSSRHSLLHPPIKTIADPCDKKALDELERQMNEYHGIPLLEKPVPNLYLPNKGIDSSLSKINERSISKTESGQSISNAAHVNKVHKIPNLLPLNSNKMDLNDGKPSEKDNPIFGEDEDSDEEIIDSEPVTGDMPWAPQRIHDPKKSNIMHEPKNVGECFSIPSSNQHTGDKKTGITEVEFDKFVRRNSTNQLNSNSKRSVLENDKKCKSQKTSTESDQKKSINLLGTRKSNSSQIPQPTYTIKPIAQSVESLSSCSLPTDGVSKKIIYNTKVQMAYQSALSAKKQKEPIKIIDDKPVKMSFMGPNTEYAQNALSPSAAKQISIADNLEAISSCDSTASGAISSADEGKPGDLTSKSKHPRKQVLTPVESPVIELIEPIDQQTQKKKRKSDQNEDYKSQHNVIKRDFKIIAPKKNYILGRASVTDGFDKKDDLKNILQNVTKEDALNKDITTIDVDNTPKRGRGRPRKHPIQNSPEPADKNSIPKKNKSFESDFKDNKMDPIKSIVNEDDDDDEDDAMTIPENWTMGKIDDNIVCPICNKLFRSENIVFKHVKHCSSLLKSPSKRSCSSVEITSSPKKGKIEKAASDESSTNEKMNTENVVAVNDNHLVGSKRVEIRQVHEILETESGPEVISIDSPAPKEVIVIEDSPAQVVHKSLKEQGDSMKTKQASSSDLKRTEATATQLKVNKEPRPRSSTNHSCEHCGKTFRQLSYLVHHKSLHNKEPPVVENKPILSCEICRKEFRQLHHLVEHREIHNAVTISSGLLRKKSLDRSEQKDTNPQFPKDNVTKRSEHSTEPFRCEPCDKSFRKLHHLVEHRETHDGANKKNSPPTQAAPEKVDKPLTASPTCDVCGKAFRKLHHLIEHREQHNESSNMEKKEKKSTLLAKDIIHECSLCYMVFPNEPSLNKHFVNCQKKKKTVDKTAPPTTAGEKPEAATTQDTSPPETKNDAPETNLTNDVPAPVASKRHSKEILQTVVVPTDAGQTKVLDTPKQTPNRKTPKSAKFGATVTKPAKIGATVTKRARPSLTPLEENFELKSADSDDEVRYMINPSYKQESDEEREIFMNVCVTKRSSLQFDNTSAKAEFKKRRTSLQHPPKNQKPLSKKVEKLTKTPNVPSNKTKLDKKISSSAVPSTSSLAEDTDIKYSFPKTIKSLKVPSVTALKNQNDNMASEDVSSRKVHKRKSLTGIAKRKSIGKSALLKPRSNVTKGESLTTALLKKVIKKQAEVRHVCDCGKPFNSSTLLAQHTSMAHTPPRVRKSRNPDAPPPPPLAALGKRKPSVTKHAGVPVALKKARDNLVKLDK